jgi:hypothetical protein
MSSRSFELFEDSRSDLTRLEVNVCRLVQPLNSWEAGWAAAWRSRSLPHTKALDVPRQCLLSTHGGHSPPSGLSYPAASQALLQIKINSRLAAGAMR